MNAERLHAIVISLNKELTDKRIVALMESMTTTLRAVVQSTNESTQQNFANARDSLYSALTNTDSDRFSPTWRQILREIGGEDLFGRELKRTIESTLEKNQLTPAIALQEFEAVYARLKQFRDALTQTIAAFTYFNIGSEKLEAGECEIGILIPRAYVKNQLPEFLEELEHEEFILNTFSEVATGRPDRLEIKALSSSGLMVFLKGNINYAAVVAVAVERIVALYKKLLEIRRLRMDMEKQELPENVVSGVETHANKLMKDGIEKASVEIVNQFYIGEDVGRKNELVVKVRLSMNMLANRIDHGVNVEVRVEPPAATDPKAKDETVQKAVAAIQDATPNMQFLKLEGPPLLQLPENAEGVEKPEKATKPERPKKKDEK
jgi:hypothetical protein